MNVPLLVKFLVYRQFEYLEREGDSDDEDTDNFVLPESLGQMSLDDNMRFVGFNGRCNKIADTCYCWWVGGTLQVIGNRRRDRVFCWLTNVCRCWAMSTSSMLSRHAASS